MGRRFADHKTGPAALRVYANCERVESLLNGRSLGMKTPDEFKRLLWENVPLKPGANRVEAVGLTGESNVTDHCDWQASGGK